MGLFLESVLGSRDPLLVIGLTNLENHVGKSGVDTRLIADIMHHAHGIMRKLGLDTSDTTARELYHALNTTVKNGKAEDLLLESDFVLLNLEGEVVSFNLIDVIENAHHQLSFESRIVTHGQRALRGAIVERYLTSGRGSSSAIEATARQIGLIADGENHVNHVAVKHLLSKEKKAPYILAIGDMVTDAFIKLLDDQAEVTVDANGKKRLSMEFGSKPPYDHVDVINAVGNSANAAVAFSRLGLNSGLMAFVGDDQAGKDAFAYLTSEGVDTSPISVQEGKKTNYHFALRYGADRTILIKYEDYDYRWSEPSTKPDWIYLSMISEDSWQLHQDLLEYLNKNPEIKFAFQPGTFHFSWGKDKLKDFYRRSHIVMMNKEEAALVTGLPLKSIPDLLKGLHELGPEIVIVTDGPDGSYASDGNKMLSMPNYPDPAPPFDRTGAGDAFASTIVAALALGESLETALTWAPANSMSVVQLLGAQAGLLDRKGIEKLLKEAPSDYKSGDLE